MSRFIKVLRPDIGDIYINFDQITYIHIQENGVVMVHFVGGSSVPLSVNNPGVQELMTRLSH
jgi:hypothetical protein